MTPSCFLASVAFAASAAAASASSSSGIILS